MGNEQLLNRKINTIFILSDIQESLIIEVEKEMKNSGELQHYFKHYVNSIKKNARLLVQMVNRHAPNHNDNFAHDADYLKSLIDKEFFSEND